MQKLLPRVVNLRLVAYAGAPVWLAGVVPVAPLQFFPLLVIVFPIGLMQQ